MIFRFVVLIFLSFFTMQSFAKYASLCSFHVERIEEHLHQSNEADQLKITSIKVSNADSQTNSNDERDCDCPAHGSGCCLYNNFLISQATHQFIYESHQSKFTERLNGFLPKPYLDTPFQPPRV